MDKCMDLKTSRGFLVFEKLLRSSRPARLWDIYTFACGASKMSSRFDGYKIQKVVDNTKPNEME